MLSDLLLMERVPRYVCMYVCSSMCHIKKCNCCGDTGSKTIMSRALADRLSGVEYIEQIDKAIARLKASHKV